MTIFQLKPKYYFGTGAINNLANEVKEREYKKVLILYGGGSIKNNGVYNEIINQLKNTRVKHYEFKGIEPNPRDTTIYKAAMFCKENKIDLIIAAGGGSVIDASKVIATLATNSHIKNTWDYITHVSIAKNKPIDIFSIITLAGTASENNGGSVVTNMELKRKQSILNEQAVPKVVFEDATYTLSLSGWQMASGMFDCLSHLLEQFYDQKTFYWTLEMQIANITCIIQLMRLYIKDKTNLGVRQNIMWTCSMALNGMTSFITSGGDWNVHCLEHALSALYDVTHGAGLALITPTYIQYRCKKDKWFLERTELLSSRLFGKNSGAEFFVNELNNLIEFLNLPKHYEDFAEINNINEDDIKFMAKHTSDNSTKLSYSEYYEILKLIPTKKQHNSNN